MKHFIQHIVKENLTQIAASSYFNYGVKGLHMINLIDSDNKGLKLFITESNNDMQSSTPNFCATGIKYPFQYYGKNVMVKCIKGFTSIWTVFENNNQMSVLVNEYEVDRSNELPEYNLTREHVGMSTKEVFNMQAGQVVNLPGNVLYNFGTRFGAISAWLVYEGKPIENLPNLTYTNFEAISSEGLYQKTTSRDIVSMLNSLGYI